MTVTPKLAFVTTIGTVAYVGLAVLGWGGFAEFFSHPARIALAVAVFLMAGVALFSGGNLSPGEREDRANRWVLIAFGLIGLLSAYLPAYTDRNDPRRGRRSLAWRGPLLRGRRAADLAGFCARPPVQRTGRHTARTYAGHRWCLSCDSSSQLSGLAGQLAGVGLCFSFGSRRAALGAACSSASCAHTCRGGAAARAVRRRVRGLLQPHLAANSGALLRQTITEVPVWTARLGSRSR
jgi:hypothetical protein